MAEERTVWQMELPLTSLEDITAQSQKQPLMETSQPPPASAAPTHSPTFMFDVLFSPTQRWIRLSVTFSFLI